MTIKSIGSFPVNSLGEIIFQAGVGSQTVAGHLDASQIPVDTSTGRMVINLPDLNALTLADLITGFVSGAGTVAATDTILQAFNKLDGNTALKALNLLTGFVSGAGTVAASDTVLQGINKLDGNVALKANTANAALTGTTSTEARIKATRIHVAAGAVTVGATDHVVVVRKTVAASSIVNLPAGVLGREVVIKDGSGDAGVNNLTITPAAGNIDGAATFVMATNYQSVTAVYNGVEWSIT